MKVEICIPAYNEAPIIEHSVKTVAAALPVLPGVEWFITVADNGSTDGTADIVRSMRLDGIAARSISGRGKGRAVIEAARASSADIFGFIDADLSADPACISELLQEVMSGSDLAIGSRLLSAAEVDREGMRTFSSRFFAQMRNVLLSLDIADSQCGLKLANRKGIEQLVLCREHGWFFDIEWLAYASRKGLAVKEVPIRWTEFYFPDRKSKLNVLRDGIRGIIALFRIRGRMMEG